MYLNNQRKIANIVILAAIAIMMVFSGCRTEAKAPKEYISSIEFEKNSYDVKVNEEVIVRVNAQTEAAKKNEEIQYSSTNEDVIEIREMTNDGFIVKGLKNGSTVIMAKSKEVTSYCEIVVSGELVIQQYILTGTPVVEMAEKDRRQVQVTLFGGNDIDNKDFVWRLENGKDNIGIQTTANIAVVDAYERGNQKIIVSHPKAEYECEIIVFVRGVDEAIQYISSPSNVVLVPTDGQYHDFSVVLVNGEDQDAIDFNFQVIDGDASVELVQNANVCNVLGKKAGSALIKVSHPKAEIDFEVRIIVYDEAIPFITVDKTFILLNVGESENIMANLENSTIGAVANEYFEFYLEESRPNVIDIVQTNNSFFIRARQGGDAKINVTNPQSSVPRQILVVVREEILYRDDYYITTSQNVITTQVGGDGVQLSMQLVNGVPADSNGFEWEVDDSTIILVEPMHGILKTKRSVINSVFNAAAYVTPLKAGTAKITVSHPKAEAATTVIVKVYPKGIIIKTPILVGALNPDRTTKGLFTVEMPIPQTVQLAMISGDITDVGKLNWSIKDPAIASVYSGTTGMTNTLNALSNGLTTMVVSGNNLEYNYEPLVLAGAPEFINQTSVIYVDSVFQKMVTEQTVTVTVHDSQNKYNDPLPGDFTLRVGNPELLYAVMVKNKLMLQGRGVGETTVLIDHVNSINDITLHITIEPAVINIDKPFYINSPEIVGVIRGVPTNIKAALVYADEREFGDVTWELENPADSAIVNLVANGTTGIVTGRVSDRQTYLLVKHPKSQNIRKILVYVVENENDLLNKVAIGLTEDHYLMTTGDEQLIMLVTNATDLQKSQIAWKLKYGDGVIEHTGAADYLLNHNGDSAIIRAVGAGVAEIVISHPQNIMPTSIFVSVVDSVPGAKAIKGPATIEILIDQSKIVGTTHVNLTAQDLLAERWLWSVEDEPNSIVNIQGNGESAYMLGVRKGVTFLNIEQKNLGFRHRAALACAATLGEMYLMGVEQTYHTMTVGDEKKIKIQFGSQGFPDSAKSRLIWSQPDSGEVRVVGSGDQAVIVAQKPGLAKVVVTDPTGTSLNETIEIEFLVNSPGASAYEFRGYDKIIGLVAGNVQEERTVTLQVWEVGGAQITHGYSQIMHENGDDKVVRVNRADNILSLKALSAGESYIEVRRPQTENARILVYTANTQEELDAYYPIVADKTNYLITVNQQVTVAINTIEAKDNVDGNLDNLRWNVENVAVLDYVVDYGKKSAVITGKAQGQSVIEITHKGRVAERIFISVVSNDIVDMEKYILTENIIGLKKGQSKQTSVVTNLSGEENALLWESLNPDIVSVQGAGKTVVLRAQNPQGHVNECYVTVSYGSWLKRHILVYLYDDESELRTYKAMNTDQQYIRMGRNEEITVPLYYAPNMTVAPAVWVDKYENKVVTLAADASGAKVRINSLNEGVAVIEATNTDLTNTTRVVQIVVEVADRYTGYAQIPRTVYLTTSKNIYLLNPDEKDVTVTVSVSSMKMTESELNQIRWTVEEGDPTLITQIPNGAINEVGVNQSGRTGEVLLKAAYLDNPVYIKIIVSRTALLGFPHITGDDVVRVGLNGTVTVEYAVAETVQYDVNEFGFTYVSGSNLIAVERAGQFFHITSKGAGSGQAKISINHPSCQFSKEVLVVVTTNASGIVYLTTKDNFSIIKQNEIKVLQVEMTGYDSADPGDYHWYVHDEPANTANRIISLSYNGRQAQVTGLKTGTAEIRVSHRFLPADFILKLYIRVTEAYVNPVYITTTMNIVSVVEGRAAYLDVTLVNANDADYATMVWRSEQESIATVTGAGRQAVVETHKPGTAKIIVTNPLVTFPSTYKLEILVVVEKDTTDQNLYISGNEGSLIEMKPLQTRQLSATLVGGTFVDDQEIKWERTSNSPSGGGSLSVVQFTGANPVSTKGANIVIEALRDGSATLTLSHSRAAHRLTINIVVQTTSEISFATDKVTLYTGQQTSVGVSAPSNAQVSYTVIGGDYINVSGTATNCVIAAKGNAGICVVRAASNMTSNVAELIVEVVPAPRQVAYVSTPEIMYNMTNWASSMNVATVGGTAVGQTDYGDQFMDSDNDNLRWRIKKNREASTNGQNIIGIRSDKGYITGGGYSGPLLVLDSVKTLYGREISVLPQGGIGVAEVEVFPDPALLAGYSKTVYINVTAHDAKFTITPINIVTDKGVSQYPVIAANITNSIEKKHDNVMWEVSPGEVRIYENDPRWNTALQINGETRFRLLTTKVAELVDNSGSMSLPWYTNANGNHSPKEDLNGQNTNIQAADGIHANGEKVYVKACEQDTYCVVKATYEGKTLECRVFIQAEKAFSITGVYNVDGPGLDANGKLTYWDAVDIIGPGGRNAQFNSARRTSAIDEKSSLPKIYPGQVLQISFDVKPPFTEPKVNLDYEEYLKTLYYDNNNIDISYYVDKNRQCVYIQGSDLVGYTQVRMTASNIERMTTVETTKNFTFNMVGYWPVNDDGTKDSFINAGEIRGVPGKRFVIKYDIFPNGDIINLVNGTNFGIVYNTTKAVVEIIEYKPQDQTVTVDLLKSDNAVLQFKSDYNTFGGVNMHIPVYTYYDRVDIEWAADKRFPNEFGIGLDTVAQAIYLDNRNNSVILTYNKIDNTNDPVKFPESGFRITSAIIDNRPVDDTSEYHFKDGNGQFETRFSGKNVNHVEIKLNTAYEDNNSPKGNLLTTIFGGTLKVTYNYADGTSSGRTGEKKFLIYRCIYGQ